MGAMIGTLAGMLIFAHTGKYFLIESKAQFGKYLNIVFTVLFSGLALGQIVKLFWKHKKNIVQVLVKSNS